MTVRRMDKVTKRKTEKKQTEKSHAGLPKTEGRTVFLRKPQSRLRRSNLKKSPKKVQYTAADRALLSFNTSVFTTTVIFPLVTPSDSLVRRSISQQKSGVSVTIDDPIRTNRKPSPPRGKVTNIIHVTNLVSLCQDNVSYLLLLELQLNNTVDLKVSS